MRELVAISLLLLTGAAAAESPAHWGYHGDGGPDRWAALSPAFAACAGRNQSPVDLTGSVDAVLPSLVPTYLAGGVELHNNGHTLQITDRGDSTLQLDGHTFSLRQTHFHAPSEHHVDGVAYPLEAHLVHADPAGQLAVIGVLFREGEPNALLDGLPSDLPAAGERLPLSPPLALGQLLPESREYFRYNGSLTTPPCDEGVRWLVLRQPITASAAQIERIAKAMQHGNHRPLQALNARLIVH